MNCMEGVDVGKRGGPFVKLWSQQQQQDEEEEEEMLHLFGVHGKAAQP